MMHPHRLGRAGDEAGLAKLAPAYSTTPKRPEALPIYQ